MKDSIGVSTLDGVIFRHMTVETAELDNSSKQKMKDNLE
jgi:hypothetical protein